MSAESGAAMLRGLYALFGVLALPYAVGHIATRVPKVVAEETESFLSELSMERPVSSFIEARVRGWTSRLARFDQALLLLPVILSGVAFLVGEGWFETNNHAKACQEYLAAVALELGAMLLLRRERLLALLKHRIVLAVYRFTTRWRPR